VTDEANVQKSNEIRNAVLWLLLGTDWYTTILIMFGVRTTNFIGISF